MDAVPINGSAIDRVTTGPARQAKRDAWKIGTPHQMTDPVYYLIFGFFGFLKNILEDLVSADRQLLLNVYESALGTRLGGRRGFSEANSHH